ncbi:glycosyltransferase 87 family protein [Nocardia sp. NPDC057455]|uniref:glycosyltransferase 87 family protein n=1 Tax=Nocardia sp. NPDC057455 TaxID=3346138 RepID=UPI00366DC416
MTIAVSAAIAVVEFAVHRGSELWAVDLAVYRAAGAALSDGHSVYASPSGKLPFIYPPFAALLFAPLSLPSLPVAMIVWNTIEAACLITVIRLCLQHCGMQGHRRRLGWAAGSTVLALPLTPVDVDLMAGQVNTMLVLIVLWDLLRSGARGQGIGIGIAAGLKLTPLIFVVYLACTGRIRQALWAIGAFGATIVASFAVLPSDASTYWFSKVFRINPVSRPQNSYNQSLRSVLARLLGTARVTEVWLVAGSVVGVLGLGAAVLLYRRGAPLAGACLCAFTGLLISPISWEHHWIWIVPMLMVVGTVAWKARSVVAWTVVLVSVVVFTARLFWWGVPHQAAGELHMSVVQQLFAASFVIAGGVMMGWTVWSAHRSRTSFP